MKIQNNKGLEGRRVSDLVSSVWALVKLLLVIFVASTPQATVVWNHLRKQRQAFHCSAKVDPKPLLVQNQT